MPVYKDQNKGTWFVVMRYTDWKGDRKTTTKRGFKTQKEAKKYESEFMDRKSNSIDMKFDQFVDLYLNSMEKRVRENTFLIKKYIFDKKITLISKIKKYAISSLMISFIGKMKYLN